MAKEGFWRRLFNLGQDADIVITWWDRLKPYLSGGGGIGFARAVKMADPNITWPWLIFSGVAGAGLVLFVGNQVAWKRYLTSRQEPDQDSARPRIRGDVLIGHIVEAGKYTTTVNGKALMDFARDYNVAIVSGINDAKIDKFENTKIAVSGPFTITPIPIQIEVNHSPAMLAEREAYISKFKEDFKAANPEVPKGTRIIIPYLQDTWNETVLIPKGASTSGIARLSDVERINGRIISREIHEGRFLLRP